MAQVSLTREERNVLVAILARHVGLSIVERQNTLHEAGLADFSQELYFQQSSKIFAGSLVDGLQTRGTLRETTGKPALVNLLQWLAENEDVGGDEEKSAFVATLLTRPYITVIATHINSSAPVVSTTSPYIKTPTPAKQRLLNVMVNSNIPPPQRAEAGRKLAEMGDPRPGVGLREYGLPDIRWCAVPDKGMYRLEADPKVIAILPTRERSEPTFWIGVYPITNLQFQAFIDYVPEVRWWEELGYISEPFSPMQWFYNNHPRQAVNWYDAMAFCAWLSEVASKRESREVVISLPTEEQWEKAARGREGRIFPWAGDKYISGYANIDETNDGPYSLHQPSPVGIYPQNVSPYGVQEMSGNVWEWCLTAYSRDVKDEPISSGATRVLRGGSWFDSEFSARSDHRYFGEPLDRDFTYGFRIVRSSPPPNSELWNSDQT